jgi:hypothetical protein
MAGFFDYLFGNMISGNQPTAPMNNQLASIPQPNLNIPPLQQNPLNGMRSPMGAAPQANPMVRNNVPPPPYAVAAGIANPSAMQPPGMPASAQNPGGMTGARNPQDDPLRKAMLMQALMGGEGEPQSPIMSGQPGGGELKGSGGFQNNPEVGLLNSFPPQMPPRKRFIGGSY